MSNRRYEGQIREQGDTVHVTSIADPTVRPYDKNTDLTTEDLDDEQVSLTVDQGAYFSFRVNDVDRVQSAGDFQGPATQRAGHRLADGLDRYAAGLYTGVDPANNLTPATEGTVTPIDVSNPATAYDVLVALAVLLDKSDCPSIGRYVVISPDFHGKLQSDDRFARVDASGSDETLRNGIVGRAAGFDVLKSNNTPSPAAGQQVVQAGIPDSFSVAEQITQTEALRAQARFADIVRGLHVYGAKLFEPTGIAVATVTVPAGM
ncbi:coat protein [Nocardiopsis sp. NPDC101807]|uniref:coat protein n=1 Tax=Nocardiopsis sp. NPDC101807 TaxID=3364339 RepID=UPI0038142482